MLQARFKSWLKRWPEWGIIILLFLVLEIAVSSIERAQWITPHPSLTLVLGMAVLATWLLYRSRLPALMAHTLLVLLGATVTVWQASNLLSSPEIASRVSQLAMALESWLQAVSVAMPSEGTLHFAVFLIFFTWVVGYISTCFLLSRQNAWVAVSLGALTILVNLGNLPEQYYLFFPLYLWLALLLLGMTSLTKHGYWSKKFGVTYPKRGIIYFLASLVTLSILAVSIAWLTPKVQVEPLETLVGTKMLWRKNIEQHFNNFLAAVPAKQSFLKSDEKEALVFGDSSFGHGDELQLVVVSERPSYWRTRMYDSYNSSGWLSSNAPEHRHQQGISAAEDGESAKRRQMTYTVVPKVRTDILLTGGDFITADIPVSVRTLAPQSFSIDLTYPATDSSLPPDVASLARFLKTVQMTNQEIGLDELRQLLPEDLTLTDFSAVENGLVDGERAQESTSVSTQLTVVELTRRTSSNSEVVAVTSLYPLKPDRRYTVTTSISSATAMDLSEAGAYYPSWVTDYYLELPSTLPGRVRRLSETVTKEAKTPYDKALAIKDYLSRIDYRIQAKAPPQGVDGVDYFLFSQRAGNCVNFASAMAVMLRSAGVPVRVSIGYAPGEYDLATGTTTLRAKDRHAWPEVYFPGYGWVGFEATPGADSGLAVASVDGAGVGSSLAWAAWEDGELDTMLEWLRLMSQEERLEWLESLEGEERQMWQQLLEWVDYGTVTEGSEAPVEVGTSPNRLRVTLLFSITTAVLLVYLLWLALAQRRQRFPLSDDASEIYRKACFLASLLGLGPQPQQTPWEYQARLASAFPREAEALDYIVQTYVERQFSRRKELDHWQGWRLQASWKRIRSAFVKRLFHIRH